MTLSTLIFSYSLPTHALSATTAKTVEGTEPYLLLSDGITKLTSLEELLGFTMPKQDGTSGTESIDASMAGTTIIVPTGMKFHEVVALIPADGQVHSVPGLSVGDDDGDASLVANTNVTGQMKATWYNGSTPITNLNQTLSGCDGVGSYTLKVEMPIAVSANTTYGAPRTKLYGSNTVTYTFISSEICYLQPNSMKIYTSADAGSDIKYADGYNSAVWEYDSATLSHKGFKANAGFPTTGFYKAVFSVIGSGPDQSNYRCTSSDNGVKVVLSGAASSNLGENCTVTYNSSSRELFTAGGTPTINLEFNNGSTWVQVDSYTIPAPTLWARVVGRLQYNTDQFFGGTYVATQICDPSFKGSGASAQAAAGARFFTRAELTNVPQRPGILIGNFSRDLGTFMGEWGDVYAAYPSSGWDSYNTYWTGEPSNNQGQHTVLSSGMLFLAVPNSSGLVAVCRQ